jgi:hypothetical protein
MKRLLEILKGFVESFAIADVVLERAKQIREGKFQLCKAVSCRILDDILVLLVQS